MQVPSLVSKLGLVESVVVYRALSKKRVFSERSIAMTTPKTLTKRQGPSLE
jgi:hypothetical protein